MGCSGFHPQSDRNELLFINILFSRSGMKAVLPLNTQCFEKFDGKLETECLSTRFPLTTLLGVGYIVKLNSLTICTINQMYILVHIFDEYIQYHLDQQLLCEIIKKTYNIYLLVLGNYFHILYLLLFELNHNTKSVF